MQDDFTTNRPWFFLGLVVAIFCFGAFIIWCYDRAVQKRQQMVMDELVKAGAIVSSIFPEAVQKRMLQDQDSSKGSNTLANSLPSNINTQKTRIKSFLENSTAEPLEQPKEEEEKEEGKETIKLSKATFAETYPEVTM
jgi:hypothetical protein